MSAGVRPKVELGADGRIGSDSSQWYYRAEHEKAKELMLDAETERAKIAAAEARLGVIVQELRAVGASWAVVAAALGVTKAAAYKRFGKDELTAPSRVDELGRLRPGAV